MRFAEIRSISSGAASAVRASRTSARVAILRYRTSILDPRSPQLPAVRRPHDSRWADHGAGAGQAGRQGVGRDHDDPGFVRDGGLLRVAPEARPLDLVESTRQRVERAADVRADTRTHDAP